MQIREIGSEEKQRWNEFVAASPACDVLQSFEWGELKRKSGGWKPIRLAVEDEGRIVAAISILKRRVFLDKSIFYASRGPICDFSDSTVLSTLLQGIRQRATSEGAILLKIDPAVPSDQVETVSILKEAGFIETADAQGFGGIQPRCVMVLDISPSLDDILAGFKPKWRYNIRLAEKKGVQVRSDCTKNDLRQFYDILKETALRDGFIVRGFEYYEHMWEELIEPGIGKLFLTEYEGEAIAGAISFVFGDRCCYTYGASSNKHRNVMPNHLMQWRMIEWAKESGCSWYDFRGVSQKKDSDSGDHLSGLNRFKEGFGAEFVEYIGEFDLPYSSSWYKGWTVGKPRAVAFLKSLRRRGRG